MRARSALLFGPLLGLAGCASLLGFDDFVGGTPAPDAGEAGTIDGGPGSGLEEAKADWYVSPKGDDAADGSLDRPLKTLSEAGKRAATAARGDGGKTIALCAGEYPTAPLRLTGNVAVLGGYGCDSWARPIATDGAPGASPSSTKLVGTSARRRPRASRWGSPSPRVVRASVATASRSPD